MKLNMTLNKILEIIIINQVNKVPLTGYQLIRKDSNKFGDVIAYYINDQLPSRTILKH